MGGGIGYSGVYLSHMPFALPVAHPEPVDGVDLVAFGGDIFGANRNRADFVDHIRVGLEDPLVRPVRAQDLVNDGLRRADPKVAKARRADNVETRGRLESKVNVEHVGG